MEGQSYDCPEAGTDLQTLCHSKRYCAAMEGQSYDCPERVARAAGVPTPNWDLPQWRGSLTTARRPVRAVACRHRRSICAAMEGQSYDCPEVSPGTAAANIEDRRAAMEGQSYDCPEVPEDRVQPFLMLATMEGQSYDCTRRSDHQPNRLRHRAAMEGQSLRLPGAAGGSAHSRPPRGPRRNGGAVLRLPGGLAPEPSRDLGFRQGLRAVLLGGQWQECIQLSRSRKSVVSQRFERWLVLQRSLDRSHQIITGPDVGSRFATPMNWKQSLPRLSGGPRSTIAIESRA